jgi:flagellar protein FliL
MAESKTEATQRSDAPPREGAPEGAAVPAPKKKLPKWMLFAAIGVVALLVIGGGVYAFMSKKGADTEQVADPKAKGKSKQVVAKKDTRPKEPAIYTAFDPPFVVNFQDKGVVRFLQVTVQVMTRDQKTAEMFKQHDPVIRNDLLLLLGNQTVDTLSSREGKDKLREQSREAIANIIKNEGGDAKTVEQLYFTSFVMQ